MTLATCKSEKHNLVCLFKCKAKYTVMAHDACVILWFQTLLKDLDYDLALPMKLPANQTKYHIVENPITHEKTKHISQLSFYQSGVSKSHVLCM